MGIGSCNTCGHRCADDALVCPGCGSKWPLLTNIEKKKKNERKKSYAFRLCAVIAWLPPILVFIYFGIGAALGTLIVSFFVACWIVVAMLGEGSDD